MRIIDLFCGIGGVAEAARNLRECGRDLSVVQAVDIDQRVAPIYLANHGLRPTTKTLESFQEFADADLWWMSPPCQPYTRRGKGLAEDDPRSQAMTHLIAQVDQHRPPFLALENVPEFEDSVHHRELTNNLESAGYIVDHHLLCPTQYGVPMRRRRFYLCASRVGEILPVESMRRPRRLQSFLSHDDGEATDLGLPQDWLDQYQSAMDLVSLETDDPVTACFTSAYGKSPVRAGSYLHLEGLRSVRMFSPMEVQRLMGFRESFAWPNELTQRARYQLLGNSLSVTVVEAILRRFKERREKPVEESR